jgi:hypothetical protein
MTPLSPARSSSEFSDTAWHYQPKPLVLGTSTPESYPRKEMVSPRCTTPVTDVVLPGYGVIFRQGSVQGLI